MSNEQSSILVTGTSSGIGRAIAVRLATDGYTIAAHYGRNKEGGEATYDAIEAADGSCRLLSFDISDAEAARTALEQDIDVVVPRRRLARRHHPQGPGHLSEYRRK